MKPDKTTININVCTKLNSQKKRNMLLVCACCFLILSMCLIQNTLAKYASQTSGQTQMNIARWDIVVNNQHIKNNAELSESITPNYLANENVAEGVIAPGSIGYFDLKIDKGQTDVSFEYEITARPSNASSVSDLVLYQYSTDGGSTLHTVQPEDDDKITGRMLMSNPTETNRTIRIYVKWVDGISTENLTNEDDSYVGHNASTSTAEVQVALKFKQIV